MKSKNKRRILMITPYLPYHSQAGGQTRSFYLIKDLAKHNDITLICFTRDQKGLSELQKYCHKVIVVNRGKTWDLTKILYTAFSTYPFLVTNYISSNLKQKITEEISSNSYDLIHVECFFLMPNIPTTKIPVILVDQTVWYAVYQHYVETVRGLKTLLKPLLWLDVLKLKFWETYYWKNAQTIAASSVEDQKIISRMVHRHDVKTVPNGVAHIYFENDIDVPKTKYPSILFGISNMKWMQNSEAAQLLLDDIWPQIKKIIPTAKLFIIGRCAPDTFGSYQNKDVIVKEADDIGQKYSPQYYYRQSWILLAPILSGGGSRTKFFEAMASSLPIVTTQQGIEGINAVNGQQAVICDYKDIVSQTIALLKNRSLRQKIGVQAEQLVKNQYSWSESASQLNLIYDQITHKN